jgi:adenylosuccinate synthase
MSRKDDLPKNARSYLETLEKLCHTPVEMVSTGPERAATITDFRGAGGAIPDRWFV